MVQIKKIIFNHFQENTYIIFNDKRHAIVIDPGAYTADEQNQLKEFLNINKLEIIAVLNTHCHLDHVAGNYFLKKHYDNIKIIAHELEEKSLQEAKQYADQFHFKNYQPVGIDQYVSDDELLTLEDFTMRVLYIPGHSPGHVVFHDIKNEICFVGDILFKGAIGRTNTLADRKMLIQHIQAKLCKQLPAHTKLYPGHGVTTTIREEQQNNPFLKNDIFI